MKKFIILSCLSVLISACTQPVPAEISDITDTHSSTGNISPSYTVPPKNIASGWKGASADMAKNNSDNNRVDNNSADNNKMSGDTNANALNNNYSNASTIASVDSGDKDAQLNTQERMVYKRDYENIPKGGYRGDSYTVKRGDTLFYIAWITGNDYRALAERNKIKEPYALNEGQVLDVGGGETVVITQKPQKMIEESPVAASRLSPPTASPEPSPPEASVTNAKVTWGWPARGRIIKKFSKASKGIDISGSLGDRVSAAADGRVVYAGNALPGYGNLIIIKNNDDYLTAYAHNQSILVKEQQVVKAGQKIATMGATGTSSVRLHFEMRYRAQPVDPLKYLPSH